MKPPVIECAAVTKSFGPAPAVDGISFALMPGEVLSILGPSGAGKTTLLRLIAGFERLDEGEISVEGRLVSGASQHVPPDRRNVGMVFQEYALFPHKTVAENISFGLHKLPGPERNGRLDEVIRLVKLDGFEGRYPHELSGGQQQRVAVARTIAPRPCAVLLDEPFSNLDAGLRRDMRREVSDILRDSGTATMFVTHDQEAAFSIADRVGVVRDGRLEQVDSPDVIYESPATQFVARMVGTGDFIAGEIREGMAATEIGALPFRSSNGALKEGSRVVLLSRPGDFRVQPDQAGPAVVRAREFLGDATVLEVEMPSGAALRCQQPHTAVAPGARVSLVPEPGKPFLAFSEP